MNNMDHIFGISGWIAKHLTGALSADEERSLDAWLKEDESRVQLFNRIVKHENLAAALIEMEQADTELALTNVKSRIRALPERGPVRLWPRIAVVAAAVAVITLGVWLYVNEVASSRNASRNDEVVMTDIAPGKNTATLTLANGEVINLSDAKTGVVIDASSLTYSDGEELSIPSASGPRSGGPEAASETTQFPGSRTMSVSTPRGGQYQVVLPDGTKVWLNADSKLSFPSQFDGRERKVLLVKGEVYFEVAKNKAKPFRVESKGQEITVLGTHFNVNAYADEGETKTTLLEGSIRLSSFRGGTTRQSQLLKPNQQAILTTDNTIQIKEVDASESIDWKNGKFVFAREPLSSIMRKVARWYDVEVSMSEDMGALTFSGSISRFDEISTLLEQIQKTNEVKFKITGRRIAVTR